MGKVKKEKKGKNRKKAEKEPATFLSATNQEVLNYQVYYMKPAEKLFYFLLAFAVGALASMVFYSGLGKDSYGNPTTVTHICNTAIMLVAGIFAGHMFLPIRTQQIIDKRKRELTLQFRELMDSLAASLGTGKNTMDSFLVAYDDLGVQFAKDSFIMCEVDNMINGLRNNVSIESMLLDFGKRSNINDVKDFASVFDTCYRKGGNLKDVVRHSYNIISDKMAIRQEIETKVLSNKTEATVMSVMPIGIVAMIRFSNPDFAAGFVSPAGIIATTVSIAIFVVAFFLSNKILRIEV